MNQEASIVGLCIQWGGVAIAAILSFLTAQSVRRPFLDYWARSWACLTLALTSLLLSFWWSAPHHLFYALYFFWTYCSAALFVIGCRNYACGARLGRRHYWAIPPLGLLAVTLPFLADDFHILFVPHGMILSLFWITAYGILRPVRRREPSGIGVRVIALALLMLTLNSLQYAVVYGWAWLASGPMPSVYWTYSSLYDLLLEMLLAFGTVIALMESACRHLEGKNHELTTATAHLQTLAEQDPLTEALNRYAFASFLQNSERSPTKPLVGCVALVDVDDFKLINDRLGHGAGDAAIRAVARCIRSIIRADDLLFRWGGDEFLILLIGLAEADARVRLEGLNATLAQVTPCAVDEPIDLRVSYGVASFDQTGRLEQTIEHADREMYDNKQKRKATVPRRQLSSALREPID